MSALFVCIIPCFAGDRGFSSLAALHTWKLVTGNDHWPHLRIPGGLLYSPCRSEQTISAQPGSPPGAEIVPTPIHPSPSGCRQRLRKALFSQDTPGMGLPGPFPRALWQPQEGQEEAQTPSSWQGWAAHTRSGAGRVPGPFVPLSPDSTEGGFHWHSPLPQISMSTLHILTCPTPWWITSNTTSSPVQTATQVAFSTEDQQEHWLFLHHFPMDLVLDSVFYQSRASPARPQHGHSFWMQKLQHLNTPQALTSPYLLWQLYPQTTPANYLNMTSLAWMSAR